MKITKIVIAILISVVIIGGAVGLYLHFNPVNKPVTETVPSWTIATKDYGTFQIDKLYYPQFDGESKVISCVALPNTNFSPAKNEIIRIFSKTDYGRIGYLKDCDVNDLEMVVIPNYDYKTNTQQMNDNVDFKFKEKLTCGLLIRNEYTSSDIEQENIIAYTLDDGIINYTKQFENIPIENKKFAIGVYHKEYNITFAIPLLDGLGKIDNEYFYHISNKNYIFMLNMIEDIFVNERIEE